MVRTRARSAGEVRRAADVLLIGALGGIAGWLVSTGAEAAGAVLLAGASALIVVAYVVAARPGGHAIEGTTEVAALWYLR